METEEININALRKLRLTGAIIVAYEGNEDEWIISESTCDKYSLHKTMNSQELNRLEDLYGTKIVKVILAPDIENKTETATKFAGYEN